MSLTAPCTCERVDVTAYGDAGRHVLLVPQAYCPVHVEQRGTWSDAAAGQREVLDELRDAETGLLKLVRLTDPAQCEGCGELRVTTLSPHLAGCPVSFEQRPGRRDRHLR